MRQRHFCDTVGRRTVSGCLYSVAKCLFTQACRPTVQAARRRFSNRLGAPDETRSISGRRPLGAGTYHAGRSAACFRRQPRHAAEYSGAAIQRGARIRPYHRARPYRYRAYRPYRYGYRPYRYGYRPIHRYRPYGYAPRPRYVPAPHHRHIPRPIPRF